MLTKIIFDYGVKECDKRIEDIYQEDLSLEGKSHVIEYVKSNDFISEINQRIVKVDDTDTEIWTIIGDNLIDKPTTDKPTIYATHDIITEKYLLDSTSQKLFHQNMHATIAFEVYENNKTSDDIKQIKKREGEETPEDNKEARVGQYVMSTPIKLKHVRQDANVYITKCMLLLNRLRKITPRTEEIKSVMHCINLAKDTITDSSRYIGGTNTKVYYNIAKYCRDNIFSKMMQVGAKAKSNKIVKFRLQDYHKKYYPLYYQTYYGNGNE
jgi:uncharacterized protein YbjQ (UPF0145 family)